jgi:hypothetical protein
MLGKSDDLTGRQYGRLRVKEFVGKHPCGRHTKWLCICICGNEKIVLGCNLKSGSTASCGCLMREAHTTHGLCPLDYAKRPPEYNIWRGMRSRCENPRNEAYHNYGGRGIKVCDRWQYRFDLFLADMGRRPSPNLTLERNDVNGDYEPSNCRWATRKEQYASQRKRKRLDQYTTEELQTELERRGVRLTY